MRVNSKPLFETFEVLKSVPFSTLQRLCQSRSAVIVGPFASELSRVLQPGSMSVQAVPSIHMLTGLQDLSGVSIEGRYWEQDVVILTDASLAETLLMDRELLRRACFASQRILILPVKSCKECFVSARLNKNFSVVAEERTDLWSWCISEEARGTIHLISHLQSELPATISFKLLVSNHPEKSIRVGDQALVPSDEVHHLTRELRPGMNELHFEAQPYPEVTRYGGMPFYFAVYNLEITVAGSAQRMFEVRPDPFIATRSFPTDLARARSWMHHAGFPVVARITENGARSIPSHGSVALPWPLMPDGLSQHDRAT